MRYIDAEKLIAEIKRLDKENKELLKSGGSIGREFLFGIGAGYADVIKIIDSIQQEPRFPQYDNIVGKVFGAGNLEGWERDEAEMLVALAKEELLKSLQQEQPEVDLKKELDRYLRGEFQQTAGGNFNNYMQVARHFYELGKLNAKKEN